MLKRDLICFGYGYLTEQHQVIFSLLLLLGFLIKPKKNKERNDSYISQFTISNVCVTTLAMLWQTFSVKWSVKYFRFKHKWNLTSSFVGMNNFLRKFCDGQIKYLLMNKNIFQEPGSKSDRKLIGLRRELMSQVAATLSALYETLPDRWLITGSSANIG